MTATPCAGPTSAPPPDAVSPDIVMSCGAGVDPEVVGLPIEYVPGGTQTMFGPGVKLSALVKAPVESVAPLGSAPKSETTLTVHGTFVGRGMATRGLVLKLIAIANEPTTITRKITFKTSAVFTAPAFLL